MRKNPHPVLPGISTIWKTFSTELLYLKTVFPGGQTRHAKSSSQLISMAYGWPIWPITGQYGLGKWQL